MASEHIRRRRVVSWLLVLATGGVLEWVLVKAPLNGMTEVFLSIGLWTFLGGLLYRREM